MRMNILAILISTAMALSCIALAMSTANKAHGATNIEYVPE